MTIRYDYQIFCEQPYGGISRYYYELICRLQQKPGLHVQLDVFSSDNIFLEQLRGKNLLKELHFKGKKDLNRILSNVYDSFASRMQPFDIFHPTYYNGSSLNRASQKPMVITIHDMIDERFHNGQKEYKAIIDLRARHIQKANKIIAVSENTRKDLIELCGVDPEKIKTIYHGNSFINNQERRTLPKLINDKYILYTGKRYAYKNFDQLLKSIAPILLGDPSINLVCAGGGTFKEAELNQIKELKITHQILYQPIHSNDQLAALYNHAEVMVYPSLYEGFGLPIIEAFACGCPVITAAGSSTWEIAGNAAVFINPKDIMDMTQKINQVLTDHLLQNQLVIQGYNRANIFSWDKTAYETLKLYQSI